MDTSTTERDTGIPCPDCDALIPVTIADLLGASENFVCPRCGKVLTLMRRESARALSELQKIQDARQNVDRHSRINL